MLCNASNYHLLPGAKEEVKAQSNEAQSRRDVHSIKAESLLQSTSKQTAHRPLQPLQSV
jgi:hypothetical protein